VIEPFWHASAFCAEALSTQLHAPPSLSSRSPVDFRLHLTERIPKNAAPTAYRWLEVATSLRNIPDNPDERRRRRYRDVSQQNHEKQKHHHASPLAEN
jgi:hypothetical protein